MGMVKDLLGNKAKETLMNFVEIIDEKLKLCWQDEIDLNFGFDNDQKKMVLDMLEHAKEHNLRSGKRLRASFVYYSYLLGGGELNEKIWRAAIAIELIHTALLMHDDFMDEDLLRRGKPTTNAYYGKNDKHYGNSMAVNLGDAVLCLGYKKLLDSGFEADRVNMALGQLLRGIENTAFGQAYDMTLSKLTNISSESVMALHKTKTAIYTYENPLFIGGILAGLDKEIMQILHKYSMLGGVAFQLQDDILGVFGDTEKTGKSDNSDLLQGKLTLLITYIKEFGNMEQRACIDKVWGNKNATSDEIILAKKAIVGSGSYQHSVDVAKGMAKDAAEAISKLRTTNLKVEAIDYLEGIARYMVERQV